MTARPELCVGGVVLCAGRMLLIRRGRGAGVGMWSIPGGRVEFGEAMVEAVAREVAEETGLTVASWRYLGHVERIVEGWHFVIHDYCADLVGVSPPDVQAGDDASDVAWVPLDAVGSLPGLAPGLAGFLQDHGILPRGVDSVRRSLG